jgi:3-methyladenine DNA glycosylase AlkD
MNQSATDIQARLRGLGSPEAAAHSARFFKTAPGQYGAGDRFHGIRVPVLRKLAAEYAGLPEDQVLKLLHSPIHEDRLLALMILVRAAARGDEATKERICKLYLAHSRHVNNWDLVDASARELVGVHLWEKDRRVLAALARSENLWERRIAIVATHAFIVRGEYRDTLAIATILLDDPHDLIHKAVGWMLREVGKRDQATLERFLAKHHRTMPRTTLRYAIERFPEPARKAYLKGSAPAS